MVWRISTLSIIVCMAFLFASACLADIPAPPVNQTIGMPDIAMSNLVEAQCRACHSLGVPDRHHVLYGQAVAQNSLVPNPDADGDGTPDPVYECMSCHGDTFTVVRDCLVCHTGASPHHKTENAINRNCVACHGDLIDNYDDGHYIPTYSPSLVTVTPSEGDGLPLNSRNSGAGACDYCHDDDGLTTPVILTNRNTHHGTGLKNCSWCHDMTVQDNEKIRRCEECHGPDSLHNIQADSPAPGNIGTIVVGGEDAGYGHIGRDAGPTESDCWGCHGFSASALPPFSGPVVPTIYKSHRSVVNTGKDTLIVLTGSAFTNTVGETKFESKGLLSGTNGSSVTLDAEAINEEILAVRIEGSTTPGNYNLRAIKAQDSKDSVTSNPAVISVVPEVAITAVTIAPDGTVILEGHGFSGYVTASGISVTGKILTGEGSTFAQETATIVSWSDTTIKVRFSGSPSEVTVNSVFGSATSEI